MRFRASLSVIAALCGILWLPHTASARPETPTRCAPAVGTADPVGRTPCFGARPGAYIRLPRTEVTCTLGFLFKDRKGRAYMSTSGHCVLPATAKRTWKPGTGPIARDDTDKKLGTFVYAINSERLDFALLQIDRGIRTNPQVCHFGGPVGLYDERFADAAVLHFYGQADAIRDVLPARSGVTTETRDPDYIYAQAPVAFGDSGGPWLLEDGRAVGYLTHIVSYGNRTTEAGLGLVRRLGPQIEGAERALRLRLTLVTAPLLP